MPKPLGPTHCTPQAVDAACAIDFGTSNSALAVLDRKAGTRLVELEPGAYTMPTAVFYLADAPD
mgnify:FL=1